MNVKKYLSLAAIFVGLLLITRANVFAQNQIFEIDLAKVDYRYNALLEFFLQKTREKDYKTVYDLLAGNFAQRSIEEITHIVNKAGLTSFIEKKWTSLKDEMKSIGVTTVKGDFTTPDEVIHHITFYVILGGETEIRVGLITEEVEKVALAKRFPEANVFGDLIKNDLKKVTEFIRKKHARAAYNYLSAAAKKRLRPTDVRKAFRKLQNIRKKVYLPKKGQIILSQDSPQLNQDGLMIIAGGFENKKAVVDFTLGYDYEDWKWKLGLFSISTQSKH